jgi:hypothetical protein
MHNLNDHSGFDHSILARAGPGFYLQKQSAHLGPVNTVVMDGEFG